MTISFQVNRLDFDAIGKIAQRASTLAYELIHERIPPLEIQMDITAVHANGCPLQLQSLLDADNSNFSHDVFGIRRHLDRDTGKLRNCFQPRFARRQRAVVS
jgi:hypothetical protein